MKNYLIALLLLISYSTSLQAQQCPTSSTSIPFSSMTVQTVTFKQHTSYYGGGGVTPSYQAGVPISGYMVGRSYQQDGGSNPLFDDLYYSSLRVKVPHTGVKNSQIASIAVTVTVKRVGDNSNLTSNQQGFFAMSVPQGCNNEPWATSGGQSLYNCLGTSSPVITGANPLEITAAVGSNQSFSFSVPANAISGLNGNDDFFPLQLLSLDEGVQYQGLIALEGLTVTVTYHPAPIADFTSVASVPKGGTVNFTDQSDNCPTQWLWTFAGSTPTTSTAQNPSGIKYNTPGTYNVTLKSTSAYGTNSLTKTIVVTTGTQANAGLDVTRCSNQSTTLTGSASYGTSPYTYVWQKGGVTIGTSQSISVSTAATATYTLTATDANGVSNSNDVVINISQPVANAGIDKNICENTSVVLNSSASAGTAPYFYAWSPSSGLNNAAAQNPTATLANTQTYTLTVTDNLGCTAQDQVIVNISTNYPVADAGADVTICDGTSTPIGGTPTGSGASGTYTYTWSPATNLNSVSVANPSANPTATQTYTVTVKDQLGCSASDNIIVTVLPKPIVDAGTDKKICIGQSVTIGGAPTASGPLSPFTYAWTPATSLNDVTLANPISTPSVATEYTVVVTGSNGCMNSDKVKVDFSVPVSNVMATQNICNDYTTGVVIGKPATAGTPAYTYSWSPTTGLSDPTIYNALANPAATTTYTLTATDNLGCTGSADVIVNVNSVKPVVTAGVDKTYCPNSSTQLDGNVSGGSGSWTILWTPSNHLSSTTIKNPTTTSLSNQTYTITVTDANGCISKDVVETKIHSAMTFNQKNIETCCDNIFQLDPTLSGGQAPYSWNWLASTSGLLTQTSTQHPTVNPCPALGVTGVAYVEVAVMDANSCVKEKTFTIRNVGPKVGSNKNEDVLGNITGTYQKAAGSEIHTAAGCTTPGITLIAATSNTTLKAGYKITLSNGFVAANGSFFHAQIEGGCNFAKVGTEEITTGNNISVFPNPSEGMFFLNVDAERSTDITVEVYSANGALVYNNIFLNHDKVQESFDLNNYASGMYFVKVVFGNEVQTRKIILSK